MVKGGLDGLPEGDGDGCLAGFGVGVGCNESGCAARCVGGNEGDEFVLASGAFGDGCSGGFECAAGGAVVAHGGVYFAAGDLSGSPLGGGDLAEALAGEQHHGAEGVADVARLPAVDLLDGSRGREGLFDLVVGVQLVDGCGDDQGCLPDGGGLDAGADDACGDEGAEPFEVGSADLGDADRVQVDAQQLEVCVGLSSVVDPGCRCCTRFGDSDGNGGRRFGHGRGVLR